MSLHQQQVPLPTEVLSYHEGYEAENGTVVQYQPEWTKQHQLEGDGLLPLLYDHLWKSDRTREHRLRDALIPDTVVFEHNFPRAWYTYDIKAQELVKRAGKLLDSQSIYKFFCTEEKNCDIVAQFYHKSVTVASDDAVSSGHTSSPRRRTSPQHRHGGGGGSGRGDSDRGSGGSDREELTTAVEFFTKELLFDFLHNRKTKPDGVLQKFLVPKGESSSRHNFQIQAVWSPLVTLVYKRTNKHRLNDKTTPVHERAATFDGLAHFSSESLVAEGTQSRVDQLCKTIVQHFLITEHKLITRLVLYFKIDDSDRIWVLWASSLRIGSDKLNPSFLRVPMQLAMRVENINGGSSREEVQQARKKMQRELVDRDVELYRLTGDWAFASQCAQKFDLDFSREHHHQSQPPSSRNATSSPAKVTAVPADEKTSAAGGDQTTTTSMIPQPPPPQVLHSGRKSNSIEYTTVDEFARGGGGVDYTDAHSLSSVPHYRGCRSAASSGRHTTHITMNTKMYISPRAPFLPTVDRQLPSDVNSPRHPLHHAYELTHDEVAPGSGGVNATSGNGGGGGSGSSSGTRKNFSASGAGSSPRVLQKKTYTVKIRKTENEKVRDDLNALAQDILYDTYSATMEGPPATATGGVGNGEPLKQVVMAPELMRCLNQDEIRQLATCLHLQQDATVDEGNVFLVPAGTLGRGRRQDRPVAQIAEDIKTFFDVLFTDKAATERVVAAWRMAHV